VVLHCSSIVAVPVVVVEFVVAVSAADSVVAAVEEPLVFEY